MAAKFRERRQRRMKALALIGLLAFLIFIATALFGESGILVNMRVKAEYERLQRERQTLASENQRLRAEILEIQRGGRKIEEIGRREFGMGRPGEVIYYFPDDAEQPIQVYRPASQ